MEKQSTKNNIPPETEKVMSFWDHLEELRWHIVRSVIAVLVLAVIAFLNRSIVFDKIILAPSTSDFFTNRAFCKLGELINVSSLCIKNLHLQIINISMSGQFMTHLYISTVAGFILAFPYILYEIWRFIKPALYDKEQKYSKGIVFISSLLFLSGVLFSYFIIVPLTVNFLGNYQVSQQVLNQVSLNSYINTVVSVTFGVSVSFELPILVYFFTKVGLLTPDFLIKNRKYMFVVLLILAAIITPPDMFSQILVVIPLMVLYELSIMVSKRVYKNVLEEE
jgi:sec-independent protein translocase protein TatC